MLPLLRAVADGQPHRSSELRETLERSMGLTDADRRERLPSGRQQRFVNRVAWARTYLAKAGLVEIPRGTVRITERGRVLLNKNPTRVDMRLLNRYPEFVSFRARAAVTLPSDPTTPDGSGTETPEEAIERAHHQHLTALADDLLLRVKALSPSTFERLVVELRLTMGHGGTMEDAGQVVGRSGDGGLDGVIKEDKLGLDMIYVQAKKWDATVGRPAVQGFAGSLQGYRATKGVFITTAAFSSDAREYVERIETRVVLIDGTMLARLMIEHNVGVTATATHQIKRVDSDYFAD
jgi:restriction system protein